MIQVSDDHNPNAPKKILPCGCGGILFGEEEEIQTSPGKFQWVETRKICGQCGKSFPNKILKVKK